MVNKLAKLFIIFAKFFLRSDEFIDIGCGNWKFALFHGTRMSRNILKRIIVFLHSLEVVSCTQCGPDWISLELALKNLMVVLVNLDLNGTLLVSNLSKLLDFKSIESLLPDELVSLLHTCELDVCFVCAPRRLDSDLQNLTEALSQLGIEISLGDDSRQVLYDSCWPLLDQIEVGL